MTNKFYSVAALFLFNAVMYAQVGINTTSPKATLDIKGSNYTPTGTAADDDKATLRIDGGASHTLDMGTTAASPYGAYMQSHSKTGSRSGLPLTLNPNGGNVGVGTLSPQTKFDISTSSNSFGLQHTDGTIQLRSYVGTGSTNNNTDAAWFGTTTNHPLDFMTNNAFRVRIDPTGNVGVGTSTPQKKMHVNGSLQVVNELNVGGNATTAGSSGTAGQVLKSNGAGAAPSWQTDAAASTLYNSNGALSGNRTVTQAGNTLTFTGTVVNAFSVAGNTLSVDAANNKVGIGTAAPTADLDVAGQTRLRTIPSTTNNTTITPVYSDASGNLVKAAASSFQGLITNSVNVTGGTTAALLTGLPDNSIYKVLVMTNSTCGQKMITEFYIINETNNSSYGLKGITGFAAVAAVKGPAFTEVDNHTTQVTWTGIDNCQGNGSTILDFTLNTVSSGAIRITNNGNASLNYQIAATRIR